MKKFFIELIGCARRQLDAERLRNYFIANGLEQTVCPADADYILLITCDLTKWHEDESIKEIECLRKYSGELIVCGCLPAMNPKRIKSIFNGKMIDTKNLEKIDKFFRNFSVKFKDIPDANKAFVCIVDYEGNKKKKEFGIEHLAKPVSFVVGRAKQIIHDTFYTQDRPFIIDMKKKFFTLRILYGCAGKCSYCNIRKAIGRLKSKPIPLILNELRKGLAQKNYKIAVISSDTGSYGLDTGSSLPELLKAILNEDKRITIEFIQDLHPFWICHYNKELIELIKTRRIKSILTAVQSGSERILKLMRRNTNLEDFKDTIIKMREAYPKLKLRTQVIIGFPTETEEDFQKTLKFLKESRFDEIDIFSYFEVEGTESAKIKPKVPDSVVCERIERMKKVFRGIPIHVAIENKISLKGTLVTSKYDI